MPRRFTKTAPRRFKIDGANPAGAIRKILGVAHEDGVGATVRRTRKTELTIAGAYGHNRRQILVENSRPDTWQKIFAEFRRRAQMKARPARSTAFQRGTITVDRPKRSGSAGASFFRVQISRLPKAESSFKINVAIADPK